MSTPTTGYEPEPAEVDLQAAEWTGEITDPLELYSRATAGQAHHLAVAAALQRQRDQALAQLNAAGLSYEKITEIVPGLTRSGVQKAVERGRR